MGTYAELRKKYLSGDADRKQPSENRIVQTGSYEKPRTTLSGSDGGVMPNLNQKPAQWLKTASSGLKAYENDKARKLAFGSSKEGMQQKRIERMAADPPMDANPFYFNMVKQYAQDTSYKEIGDNWTEEQKQEFGYLYASDKKQAEEYAIRLNNALKAATKNEQRKGVAQKATDSPLSGAWETAKAIGANTLGIGEYVTDMAEYAARGRITEKSDRLSPVEYAQAVTGSIAAKLNGVDDQGVAHKVIDERVLVFGGKGWGDVYQLGTSIAQSIASGHLLGGTGTLISYFGSAAASGIDDAKSRGATDEQAVAIGTLQGIAEGLAEKIGVDNLLKLGAVDSIRGFMRNVAVQAGREGIEEGLTSLFNNISDDIVMGENSLFYDRVNRYVESGMEESNARKRAWLESAEDIVFDMVAGAASGGISGGLKTGARTALYGLDFSGEDVSVQSTEVISDALKKFGETENVDAVAAAVVKAAAGQEMTISERKILKNSLLGEWMVNTIRSDSLRDDPSGKMGSIASAHADSWMQAAKSFADAPMQTAAEPTQEPSVEKGGENASTVETAPTEEMKPIEGAQEVLATNPTADKTAAVSRSNSTQEPSNATELSGKSTLGNDNATPVLDNTNQGFDNATAEDSSDVDTVRTLQISTGEPVEITKISAVDENGGMTFQLSDGRNVDASDIQHRSEGEAVLYEAVADLGASAQIADILVNNWKNDPGGVSAEVYTAGMLEAFNYGRYHIPEGEMASNETISRLTSVQSGSAYALGKTFGSELAQTKEANIRRAAAATRTQKASNAAVQKVATTAAADSSEVPTTGAEKVHFDRQGRTLSAVQETGLKTMEQLSQLFGTEFHVFESYEKDGKRVFRDEDGQERFAPNGWYDPETGHIHIDLNAGSGGRGTMLFTVAHELTHFIQDWSPAKFDTLAEAIFGLVYKEKNISVIELIREQQAKAQRTGCELSFDEAYEEVVADSMESILTSGNVVELMAEVKQQDQSLWRKIQKWFQDLAADIRKMIDAYTGFKPDSAEGRAVAAMEEMLPVIESFYMDALQEASDNYQAMEGQKNTASQVGGKKNSFAGRGSASADRSAFQQAEQLQEQGVDNEIIRQQTGWYKGMDGKWRYEIDDSQMEIADNIINYMRLGELMRHDKLYAAYPDLAHIDVVFQGLEPGVNGSYHPQFDSINLNYRLKNDPVGLKDALMHEIQHAIQHREGFTSGTTAANWERKIKAGFDSRRTADIRKAQETERELRRIQEEEPEFYRDMVELDAMTPDLPRGEIDWETLEKIQDDPVEWQQYDARREELEAKYGDTKVWDMNDLLYQREQAAKNVGRSGVELYFDTAGEIEARDASNRRSKTAEQRKSSPPRLGNEDTVFAERNSTSHAMTEKEIAAVQKIGRVSVNAFTTQDIRATEGLARRYWNEMGTKSPFFRAWFGDWRLNDHTPVQVATRKGDTRGVLHNDDTGWDITVSGQVFNETKSHRGLANKSAQPYLPYINDIVRKAVLLDSHGIGVRKAKSDNSLLMHSMYAVADIGSGPEVLKLYVEEMNNPASDLTTKRSYQLQNIEKAFNASVRVQGQAPSSLTSTLNAVKIIADLFTAVKKYDTAFSPNPVSKAVNADGTPMEMYHGTSNSGFTVFNTYGGNFGLFGKGSYFTDNPEVANSYTRKGKGQNPGVYGVYLSIKNPLDMDANADLNAWKKAFENADLDASYLDGVVTNEDAFRQLKENLADDGYVRWEAEDIVTGLIEGMGYDGITHIGGGRYGTKDGPKHRVYITFESEQIKSATDNIGTFDGSKPDIRYSQRDPLQEKAVKALEKENARLKEDVQGLKELVKLQGKVTGGKMVKPSSVEAAARVLKKNSDAIGNTKELAQLLTGFYSYITKGEELTWEGVQEAAQAAANWLWNNRRRENDEYSVEILKDLRTRGISFNEEQRGEAVVTHDSFGNYRKALFGSVKITKQGMPLDEAWHDLAGLYPGVFPEDTNSGDMPRMLVEIVDRLRSGNSISQGYDEAMVRQDLIREVYDSYWQVSTLHTVADVKQKEINRLKSHHAQRMEQLRTDHREKVAQLRQEQRSAVEAVRTAERQKAQERTQKVLAQYRDNQKTVAANRAQRKEKTELRRKIRKTVFELDKLLNRGDKKKNVKDGMSEMVSKSLKLAEALFMDEYSNRDMLRNGVGIQMTDAEEKIFQEAKQFMESIESGAVIEGMEFDGEIDAMEQMKKLDGKLSGKMTQLKDVFARERKRLYGTTVSELLGQLADEYSRLSEAEDGAIRAAKDENVYAHLLQLQKDVGGTTVRDMNLNQLEQVADAYTMVLTTVRNANKMFAKNLKFKRDALAGMVMGEIGAAAKKISKLASPGKDAADRFSWNNLKPVYAFERLGSQTMKTLFGNIRKGQDVWAVDMQEANSFRRDQYKKHKRKDWDMEKQYSFEFESGKADLSLEQIMSLYAYSRREAALDHLLKGGFVFGGSTEVFIKKNGIKRRYLKKDATAYNLSADELLQVIDSLTKEQKAFVEEMQTYLSDVMGGKGNEVSMQMYGIKSFGEKNYFPLRSAGQYMEKAKEDSFRKEQGQISIVNSGFTKATTPHASNPITLDGFMDVWAEHVNDMAMYHGFVLPMEDFRRVYNYSSPNIEEGNSQSVNAAIENAFGKAATGYIDQLYKDLNGGAVGDNRENLSKKLVSLHKKAAVFASASVVIQQPSAIVRAFALIDPRHFIGPKVDHKRHKLLWEEVKKYAPVAFVKEMGYFDTGMGRSAKDFLQAEEYSGIREKMTALFKDADYRDELLGKAPALADEITWCSIWETVKRETKAKNPGMNVKSDAFLQIAGERFSEVIDKTQVYDSVLSRSANMRSKSGLMNMITSFMAEPTTSINMLEDALRKGDRKQLKRTVGAVYGSVLLNSLLVSLVYAARDDDEDETYWEKYLSSLAVEMVDGINPITYYPFLRDVWSIGQGFDVERADMTLITDFADAAKKVVQSAKKVQEASEEEEQAAMAELKDSLWGMVDNVASLTGLPVKNIRRDIEGAVNLYKTISTDLTGRKTTALSLRDTVMADVMASIPIGNLLYGKNKRDRLYGAIKAGDTAYVQRLRAGYKTDDSYHTAIKQALRDNDSRIWEAAVAWNSGNLNDYLRITKEIRSENRFEQDDIVLAIRAEASSIVEKERDSSDKVYGYFTAEKFGVAISQNNTTMANIIKTDLIDTAIANGKTRDKAEENFVSSATNSCKTMFLEGDITESQAINALVIYCGKDEDKARDTVADWKIKADNPDSDLSADAIKKYQHEVASSGISLAQYEEYRNAVSGITGEGKKKRRMDVINSMPISAAQKDALYFSEGWSKSTLHEAPWH